MKVRLELSRFSQKPPCISHVNEAVLMLISSNLHRQSSEFSIKTKSPQASLSFKGQTTMHTTLKRSIAPKIHTKMFITRRISTKIVLDLFHDKVICAFESSLLSCNL